MVANSSLLTSKAVSSISFGSTSSNKGASFSSSISAVGCTSRFISFASSSFSVGFISNSKPSAIFCANVSFTDKGISVTIGSASVKISSSSINSSSTSSFSFTSNSINGLLLIISNSGIITVTPFPSSVFNLLLLMGSSSSLSMYNLPNSVVISSSSFSSIAVSSESTLASNLSSTIGVGLLANNCLNNSSGQVNVGLKRQIT